jgi:hypothetical protein
MTNRIEICDFQNTKQKCSTLNQDVRRHVIEGSSIIHECREEKTHMWQVFWNEIGFEFIRNRTVMSSCYHGQTMISWCVVVLRSVRISMQPVNIERTLGAANIRPTPSNAGIKNEWIYTSIPLIFFQELHTLNSLRKLLVTNATSKCHFHSKLRHSALFVPSAEYYMPHYVRWEIQFSWNRYIDTTHSVLQISHTIKHTDIR